MVACDAVNSCSEVFHTAQFYFCCFHGFHECLDEAFRLPISFHWTTIGTLSFMKCRPFPLCKCSGSPNRANTTIVPMLFMVRLCAFTICGFISPFFKKGMMFASFHSK